MAECSGGGAACPISPRRALLAAVAAWGVLQVVTVLAWTNPLTMRLILSPDFGQSQKLINVWTVWQPLPRITHQPPLLMMLGFLFYAVLHVAAFIKLFPSIPGRRWKCKGMAFGAGILIFQYGYFEFFGPFNQYHEPLPLISYELLLQALMALSEALVISRLLTPGLQSSPEGGRA
jgi:hypothetical protein